MTTQVLKYQSQSVSRLYFIAAMVLFAGQIIHVRLAQDAAQIGAAGRVVGVGHIGVFGAVGE